MGYYVEDGRLDLDNNAAERALRAVASGRKNYLFAGSDAGGDRLAIIYSLIGTAKLNGLVPEKYLGDKDFGDGLTRIADQAHHGTPAVEPTILRSEPFISDRL